MITELHHGEYAVKFARQAKAEPTAWVIAPLGRNKFELRHIGFRSKKPDLRSV